METLVTIEETNTQMVVMAYLIYLPVALLLTFFVARNIFRNGKVYMMDIFGGREEIAFATNRLFEMGFYLLNLGFALMILKIDYYLHEAFTYQDMIEVLSLKVGGFSIYLGIMLFFNLYLFFRGKRKAKENAMLQKHGAFAHPQAK